METSTEKQLPVSNRSCNLLSKSVKRSCQKTCQTKTFSNLDLVSEWNIVVTNDTSCQVDFQREIGKLRYNENVGDKITEKETKEQIIENSRHHSDKKLHLPKN